MPGDLPAEFDYFVMRLVQDSTATDRVILFHVPPGRDKRSHIRRIEKLSDWRYVGSIRSPRSDLDRLCDVYGMTDQALLKRTGVDVTRLGRAA